MPGVTIRSTIGAAALLLWGVRMVRTGVMRAYGAALRRSLGNALGNRFAEVGQPCLGIDDLALRGVGRLDLTSGFGTGP